MTTAIQSIIAKARAACTTNPSVALVVFPETGVPAGSTPAAPYSAFLAAWRAIAAADPGIALIDLSGRFPAPATNNTLGLFAGDLQHPTDKGHSYIGGMVGAALAPARA